jgi:hypothetical protein
LGLLKGSFERRLRMDDCFEEMRKRWHAPVVVRNQAHLDRFSGGLLNAGTLANHDSAGTGPKGRIRFGRKVAYPVDSLVEWMRERGEAA